MSNPGSSWLKELKEFPRVGKDEVMSPKLAVPKMAAELVVLLLVEPIWAAF